MKKLNSIVQFPHIVDMYEFDSPEECDRFVTEQRANKVWASKDGSRGQKPKDCTFACVKIQGAADCTGI